MAEDALEKIEEAEAEIDPPPVFGSWRNIYVAVLLHLAGWIALFALFTAVYSSPQ